MPFEGTICGRHVRWLEVPDLAAHEFERELVLCTDIPLMQSLLWVRYMPGKYRIFQITDKEGKPSMQAIVHMIYPARLHGFVRGRTPRLMRALHTEDESEALSALLELSRRSGVFGSLRLQPMRAEMRDLLDFQNRARRLGCVITEPLDYTRTLYLDLRPDPEAILASLAKKIRYQIRSFSNDVLKIQILDDERFTAACERAFEASMKRSGSSIYQVHFDGLLRMARAEPSRVRILGIFMRDDPEEPVAFVIGFRHGVVAEYNLAGSLDIDSLRKISFNYRLLWDLSLWAREQGSQWLDLGGVTDCSSDDPLIGISQFKRRLSNLDRLTGCEMISVIHPIRHTLFEVSLGLRGQIRHVFK